jgi:hypothetical protein
MKTSLTMLITSDLHSFLPCLRQLWLAHHDPHLLLEADLGFYRRVTDGNIVGEKAREL